MGVINRSPGGQIYVMFGPVVTTEAHLAFSGARTHSSNTAELTAMIEALAFLDLQGPVTPNEQSCIFLKIPCMLLANVWTRSRTALTCGWRLLVNSL